MAGAEMIRNSVEQDGFVICENALSNCQITELLSALDEINEGRSVRKRSGVFAVRNLLDESAAVRELAASETVRELVAPVLGQHFFPVRGILFDKIPGANWKVPWHQDLTIAVQERIEVDGYGPWSIKADVLHVQPPASILEDMLTIRFHLDDCFEINGALRVISGSHQLGRISESEIEAVRNRSEERVCDVAEGGALIMRPLLLHASSPSIVPGHRRVVHLDFACVALPAGMRWFSAGTPAAH